MRIAMTSLYLPGGSKIGVGYQVHHMANEMVRRGHSVTVFSQHTSGEPAAYNLVQIPARRRLRTFSFPWDLRKVDFSEFDVLHAHGDDWFLWGKKRPRHIHTYHGSCFAEFLHQKGVRERARMLGLAACEWASVRLCDESVAVSRCTRIHLPAVRHVIPNGVDLDSFNPANQKEASPVVLFVGTLRGRKRGNLLVKTFCSEVRLKVPNAVLWAVCEEPVSGPGVLWMGRVPFAVLCDLYRRAWVFCLPSTYEGFGIPYIEAMASGTAVVATPNHGALEVLRDGVCGLVVPDTRLGSSLVRVLRDAPLRKHLEETGLQQVQQYSWDRVCVAYEALYSAADSNRRARAEVAPSR
jgi:glycosyltransferase involved in cell wall biosynthesis